MTFKQIPEHAAFLKDGKRILRYIKAFANVDFPERIVLPDGPTLFAANHRSLLDVFVANAVLAKFDLSCHFLVRADFFDQPVMGNWLRRIGCIPTSSKVKEEAIATAIDCIRDGRLVALMPEGRLVPPQDRPNGVGQGRAGVSIIATAAGAQVVPVGFRDSDLVWPRGQPVPLPSIPRKKVAVLLDTPMDLPSSDHQENADAVMDRIQALIA